ncbi:flagellar motor switch protein FliN [Tatumella morbirosei]|uniref:Flagellar motor switch protein FliN n=1 Tax=Tatumella morbirosei TaxID=642227 RepID=A0A095UBU2_9GAMM|nr:flagellar motor switch protein FliN [Tatumella morbirosei]KGD71918.1 flagellar motor switch protein FliN [Tatumella morbirosei]
MSDIQQPAENSGSDDVWADALEQQATTVSPDTTLNSELSDTVPTTDEQDVSLIMDIPVRLTVELGRTRMTIKELLRLTRGSIVPLEGLAGEPLDILINNYLIAQGEVVVVNDKYGVRITDIITPSERMRRLSR